MGWGGGGQRKKEREGEGHMKYLLIMCKTRAHLQSIVCVRVCESVPVYVGVLVCISVSESVSVCAAYQRESELFKHT